MKSTHKENAAFFDKLTVLSCHTKVRRDKPLSGNSAKAYDDSWFDKFETLIRFADYFDVSIDYLLERTNNPNIQK